MFENYFSVFPWDLVSKSSVGFDLGCGSGRWAEHVAPRVSSLHCIDPSEAITVAQKNLSHLENCVFHKKGSDEIPLPDGSMDFGYSLGVLHHIPDTQKALDDCVRKLKPGAPFLLYIYYNFDNKPKWYRWIWKISESIRLVVSKLPHQLRYIFSQLIAAFIYLPMSRCAKMFEKIGFSVKNWPLSFYRNCSFYTMRTDALDRFGTRLEKRYSREEIYEMMEKAGLENIKFSEKTPFWVALGVKNGERS